MALDSMRNRLSTSASRADLPVSTDALSPAVMRAIAEGFAIEHGQEITDDYIQQLTTANAQYYVSLARNARAERGHDYAGVEAGTTADGERPARSHRFRSKRKIFGFAGAGMAAILVAVVVFGGGSDNPVTTAPKSLTNKVIQNDLTDTTASAGQATSGSAETVPTDPNGGGIPASSTPTPSPSPTPVKPSPSPSPTPVTPPAPSPEPDPTPTPTPVVLPPEDTTQPIGP